VRRIAKEKGNVAFCDLNEEAGKRLAEAVNGLFIKLNVCDEQAVKQALETVVQRYSRLDGIIQCAGIGTPQRILSSRGTVHSLKAFNDVIGVNLVGTFNVMRFGAAIMAKQDPLNTGERGVIINVASVAAFEGQIGQAAYSASKGGIVAMTLPVARELGQLGIRINTIAPGIFETPLVTVGLPPAVRTNLLNTIPFPKRLGHPDEFAALCVSVVENTYINGTVLRIDGSIRMAAL